VFTSALTPLAGIGVISLERVYPLTLGSNIGTTTTGLLAAAAGDPRTLQNSMQLALCHLLFNITGILLFYPLPFTRIPVTLARTLGRTTARYRWFAIFYLFFMFLILPLCVFLLSLLVRPLFAFSFFTLLITVIVVIILNCVQRHRPSLLPTKLRTWQFLPIWLRSLDPYDALLLQMADRCFLCTCCVQPDAARDLPVIRAVGDNRHPSRLHILDAAGADSCSDVHLVTAYDNVMFVNWSATAGLGDSSRTGNGYDTHSTSNAEPINSLATEAKPNVPNKSANTIASNAIDCNDNAQTELVKFYVDSNATSPK
jgi:hypothetical protein